MATSHAFWNHLAIKQHADVEAGRSLKILRPSLDLSSLASLQRQSKDVLKAWHFPVVSDVMYDIKKDGLVIDGKTRAANGKGVRAVSGP